MGRLERVVVREGNGNVMVTNIIPGDRYFIGYLMENNGNGTLTKIRASGPADTFPFRRTNMSLERVADGGGPSSGLLSGPGPQFQHQTVTLRCAPKSLF